MADVTTTTTVQPEAEQHEPAQSNESVSGGQVDATSIVRGKKINPRTGTQTTDDDPNGVYADNVYNQVQIEHTAHTQTQTTPGAGELLAETIQKSSGNDGNVTPVEPKPVNEHEVQDDSKSVETSGSEEVKKDGQVQQGETGAENREDLQDLHGGGSGSNADALT